MERRANGDTGRQRATDRGRIDGVWSLPAADDDSLVIWRPLLRVFQRTTIDGQLQRCIGRRWKLLEDGCLDVGRQHLTGVLRELAVVAMVAGSVDQCRHVAGRI